VSVTGDVVTIIVLVHAHGRISFGPEARLHLAPVVFGDFKVLIFFELEVGRNGDALLALADRVGRHGGV